jgi:hypothetical protein
VVILICVDINALLRKLWITSYQKLINLVDLDPLIIKEYIMKASKKLVKS